MKKIFFAVLLIVALTLSACDADTLSTPTPIALIPNPSAPPDDALNVTSCVTIYPAVPDDVKLDGFAVLDDYGATSNLFLKNLQNGKETPLATPEDTVSDVRISLDHKTIGYQLGNPKTGDWSLVTANATGQRTSETIWKQGFFILGKWVNNDSMLLLSLPPFVVFNPSTKQETDFDFSDFPGYLHDPKTNRIIEIDSTLQRAAYKNDHDKVSIYDIPNKKVIAEVDNHPNPSLMAEWAPDGSKVAVNGTIILSTKDEDHSEDVFSVTRDGQVKRLTHLTDHYGRLVSLSKAGMSWSPDGRYLAFWIAYPQNNYDRWELVVYDSNTDKTTNYCISSDYESQLNSTHYLTPPAWSPDSKYMLVENRYDKKSSRVLVVDIATKNAYQIDENKFPAGWVIQ